MRDINSVKDDIVKQLREKPDKVSIVKLVDLFVEFAYTAKASDIHIEPQEQKLRVRFRIDGVLHDSLDPALVATELHQEIITRIKVLSGLRTDEHNLPQDGRFKVNVQELGEVDVRVSILPTRYGENAILRILAETQALELEDLGLLPTDLEKVKKSISKPYGMILANGPTGSGKTTTLYTVLKRLNKTEVSVITLEDPVEYGMPGATQVQVNTQIGLTFAHGLRSVLRQDPNIIMVGEIRDEETASIAVNAALTGHLVLSTLHTNDAATTFPRLIDMGVPPFLVASTVNIAMGQRLVRTICKECKQERELIETELKSVQELIPDVTKANRVFYVGKGCTVCDGTGYKGRVGIREVLEVNEEIRTLIMKRASAQQIKDAAVKHGMTTMLQDGLKRALAGQTTLEEILRIIHE